MRSSHATNKLLGKVYDCVRLHEMFFKIRPNAFYLFKYRGDIEVWEYADKDSFWISTYVEITLKCHLNFIFDDFKGKSLPLDRVVVIDKIGNWRRK